MSLSRLAAATTLAFGFGLAMAAAPLARSDHPEMLNVFPADLRWANVPSIPKDIQLATVYGDPSKPGPYIFRARMPAGTKLWSHRHPDERLVTVLQGVYRSAVGEAYDVPGATEYPEGSFYVTAANAPHFSYAVTDVIVQEQGVGPTGIEYVHAEDDPRRR